MSEKPIPPNLTQEALLKMIFELLVEFSEHLESKLPGSGPLLGRAFIWTGAGRLAGEHDPSIASAVLKDVLQDVENGWLNPVPPKEESPTLQ